MRGKEHNAVRPLGVCRRLYNFVIAILSSRAIANGLSQEHSSNNGNSEIKIEFSEAIQKGKKMKIGSADDNNVKIKFKSYDKQAQGVEHSFTRRETKRSSGKVKQTHSKETSLHDEEGDEDAKVVIPQERLPSRVFSDIDSQADDFIRSRLEAMRRSH